MALYKKTDKKSRNKRIFEVISIFAILMIIFLLLNKNQNSMYSVNIEGKYPIKLIVSEDFGKSILLNENLQIEGGESSVDVLFEIANVTTTYGGGYVQSIDGIKSQYNSETGVKKDWLYYVNGILASVGAGLYKPYPNDIIHWDYHDWVEDKAVTAIIGSYPEPFLHGYNGNIIPTIIIYSDDFYDTAIDLQNSLEKLGVSTSKKSFKDLTENEKQSHNLILIGTYENDLIENLNSNSDQLGWFVKYENDYITTFDKTGKTSSMFEQAGVICATQNIWNPKGNWHCENVIWVVSGLTYDDVRSAANLLISNDLDIQNHASIIVVNKSVHQVP